MLYEDALLPKECGCHLTSDCLSSGGDVSRVRRGSQAWKSMSDDSMGIRKPPREDYLVAHIRRNYIHSVKINKKQNPKKCTFGATEGMFLGYLIEPDGIKPCPEKTKAVIQLPSPRTMKEVQSLNGKLAGLNRFLSKSADKSLPLFKTLKKCTKKGDFRWTTECRRSYSPTNNEAEYEALIAGLRIAARMGVRNLEANVDSRLVANHRFASVKHPQTNGLVERANRSLGEGIKARLDRHKGRWVEELSHVLWAHRTTIKGSTGDTPFSLVYGTEADLDILEERREQAAIREEKAKSQMKRYYDAKVRGVSFRPGDFVYRANDASHAEDTGKLGPKLRTPN
ncbi:reverse transcriptase domain-containing protein [Tanacetum coccineum]|uniref:Reverse transcriptase domain-containing protein n=1 Tax=Tanacetum coccineum TaxID=301880 RepID=A0ABQ4WII2_9ASTR